MVPVEFREGMMQQLREQTQRFYSSRLKRGELFLGNMSRDLVEKNPAEAPRAVKEANLDGLKRLGLDGWDVEIGLEGAVMLGGEMEGSPLVSAVPVFLKKKVDG